MHNVPSPLNNFDKRSTPEKRYAGSILRNDDELMLRLESVHSNDNINPAHIEDICVVIEGVEEGGGGHL